MSPSTPIALSSKEFVYDFYEMGGRNEGAVPPREFFGSHPLNVGEMPSFNYKDRPFSVVPSRLVSL